MDDQAQEVFAAVMAPPCIRLPYLRGSLPPELDSAQALMPAVPLAQRLWPGHRPGGDSVPEGWHQPVNYPFSWAEASACLAAFAALNARDLADERDAADMARQARRAHELGELADLAAFAAREKGEDFSGPGKAARQSFVAEEQAQKLLLWLWLQEEHLAEVAKLAAGCARGLNLLAKGFGEGGDEALQEGPDLGEEPQMQLHEALIPPWRVAVASVALFVEQDAVFFVEGPMRHELLALLDFRPARDWGERLGCTAEDAARMVGAFAPLWRVLGRSRPERPDKPRLWLTWGQP